MEKAMFVCHNILVNGADLRELGSDTLDTESYGDFFGELKTFGAFRWKFWFEFNWWQDGIGQLKVVDGGVQLEGQAVILDELKTSHIRSRHGLPITFG